MSDEHVPTVRLATAVYGSDRPDPADPVEVAHEATKLKPSLVTQQLRGAARLAHDPALRVSSGRALRRHATRPIRELPAVELPRMPLGTALRQRRSIRSFARCPIRLEAVAALVGAAYGVTRPADGELPPLRTVPSGGALFPLDLFLLARDVSDLSPGVYHYDPLLHGLERQPATQAADEPLFADDVADSVPLVVFVAAAFRRSRFKYGFRGYRFTLLEAGHVVQNLVLAATATELGSLVLGSLFDGRVDRLLGLNGVDESTLIAVCVGARA